MIATNTVFLKIKLSIIILLIISSTNLSQQKRLIIPVDPVKSYLNIDSSENSMLNRLTLQSWNGSKWINTSRNDNSYDSLGRINYSITKRWSSKWINQYKYILEWEDSNKRKKYLYMTWNGIGWDSTMQFLYTYNNEYKNVEIISQNYVSGNWKNYYRTLETYSSDGDLLTSTEQYWNGTLWINFALHEYQYIAPKMLSELLNSEWSNGNWVKRLKDTYTYSGSRVTEYLHQETDSQNPDVWISYHRITYLYYGNTIISTRAYWDNFNEKWWDQSQYIEVYLDPEIQYLSTKTGQYWDGENNIWSPDSKQTNIYDSEMNLTQSLHQTWGGTGWRFYWRQLYQYGLILKPEEDDILISAEKDTIKWTDNWKGKTLNIEYSDDDEVTYNTVAEGISGDSCKYIWDVPDSILSAKCFVKITESNISAELATSDKFGIRPYILTRTDTTTDEFVLYDINKDRWGFRNDSAEVWPDWWYERFEDYTGNDPFTGKPYTEFTADSAFLESMGYEFPDWVSFVWAFSPSVCYIDISKGIYSLTAVKRWSDNSDEWGGSCFGIAGTNALAFMQRGRFTDQYKDFPNFTDPINVLSDSNVIPVISEIFTHQFGKPSTQNIDNSVHKTANETLRDIKAMLKKSDEARMLVIFNQNGKGAHGILPYKLEKDKSNGNIYYLYVYDNSYSNVPDAKIKIDTTANGNTGSWEPLYGWSNWGGNKGMFLEVISDEYLDNAGLYKKNLSRSVFVLDPDKLEVLTSGENDIIIKNTSQQMIGYQNNQIIQDVPEANPIRIINGSETPPYGYNLPNNEYTIETSNFTNTKTSTDIYTGNKIFTVSRNGAVNNQKDQLHYWSDQKIVLNNPSGETNKTFKLSEIINETTQEKMYILRDIAMNGNDAFEMMNTDTDKLKITNNGSEKNYSIELQYVDENKSDRFLSIKVSIPFSSNHIITPDWTNIVNTDLMIFVDLGNNGTVDDTLRLENQVTGIEDQGSLLPKEYRLEQNFPNPFNNSTVIRYSIPKEGLAELTVYNILGEEVATLVNEVKEAGNYEVILSPENLTSGVYFYRLQAGRFMQTKKMILMK